MRQAEFLAVIAEHDAKNLLDLGCGTGRLALGIAATARQVTGVDPAAASLDAARRKQGAASVTWLHGTSADLPSRAFDAAVMTSHVAQFFVDDAEWGRTLSDLHRALVPGGVLAFDARDPADRRWERWNPIDSRRIVGLPDGRTVEMWTDVPSVRESTVDFAMHYRFPSGEELVSTASLRFRSEAELRLSLQRHGFTVHHIHGGWDRQPVGHGDGELLVVAVNRQ